MIKPKFKFVVKDNRGMLHISPVYTLVDDIIDEERIREDMEELIGNEYCNCFNESQNHCECEPSFDNGEIIEVIPC